MKFKRLLPTLILLTILAATFAVTPASSQDQQQDPVIPPPYEVLYVDGFTAEWILGDMNLVGTPPYLDAPDDGNYIEGTEDSDILAWFSFEDTVLRDGEICKVVLEGYTDGPYNEDVEYDIYAPDFTWLGSWYATGEPAWVTPRWVSGQTVDERYPAVLTRDGLNNFQVLVYFYDPLGYGPGTILDALRLKVWLCQISINVDVKPGSWPNPLNLKSKGVLPVAVCGTEDFDVTTIDPTTIRLTIEGVEEGVMPLRWSYEDVATPYTGEPGGGHALGGDGYLDLTLKFDTQDLVNTLGLSDFKGQTIPLILTGNLKEEFSGTQIKGQDYVWILK